MLNLKTPRQNETMIRINVKKLLIFLLLIDFNKTTEVVVKHKNKTQIKDMFTSERTKTPKRKLNAIV